MTLSHGSQFTILAGATALAIAAFVYLSKSTPDDTALPSDDAPVPDAALLASGGLPIDPTWYWGANQGIGNGDIYLQVNPDIANFLGDELTPLFGFVGFAGY